MRTLRAGDPDRIGDYRLLGRLGEGGMGRVYLAQSPRGRTVAVKLVKPELAGHADFRTRFEREISAARRVGGEWTAPVLDADTTADQPWVATGYIPGLSLHELVSARSRPLPARTLRILANRLALALRAIHEAGLIHRDLKPSNILVTIDGPRVIDFGIARALETVADGHLTRTGAVVGSPGFMSPEQVRGIGLTPASDVFCLGSVLAFAATGRTPFGAADNAGHALLFRVVQDEAELSGVPEELRELVADCLTKEADGRPALDDVLRRTADDEEQADPGEPWLPGDLVAQLGRHAARLLDVEVPEAAEVVRAADAGGVPYVPLPPAVPPRVQSPPLTPPPLTPPPPAVPPAVLPEVPPEAPNAAGTPPPPPETPPAPAAPPPPAAPPVPPPGAVRSAAAPEPEPDPGPASGVRMHGMETMTNGHTGPLPPVHGTAPPTVHDNPASYGPGYGGSPGYGGTPAYGGPERGKGFRRGLVLVAVAVVGTLISGAATFLVLRGLDDKDDRADKSGDGKRPGDGGQQSAGPDSGEQDAPTEDGSQDPSSGPPGGGEIPQRYLGSWQGTVMDPGSDSEITRRFEIKAGSTGEVVATTVNLHNDLLCEGEATLVSFEEHMVVTSEITDSAPPDSCSPYGEQRLKVLDDGSMEWAYPELDLSATLHKVSSAKAAVPKDFLGSWKGHTDSDEKHRRRLTFSQGPVGSVRLTMVGDGPGYHCEWDATLAAVEDGTLNFGPGVAGSQDTDQECRGRGSSTAITVRGENELVVQNPGSDGSPRTYRRAD